MIGGGSNNVAGGAHSVIAGGVAHGAAGDYATVAGGFANLANGPQSFAAGSHAKAVHRGAFVWADSQPIDPDFFSVRDDEFAIRARGGVRLSENTPAISFGDTTRQMLNLWNTAYGIGVQSFAEYFRSGGDFIWYQGGTHRDAYGDPGPGGTQLMSLTPAALNVNENVRIAGVTNVLELGAGDPGKDPDSAKIAYGLFSGNALDIVGAGTEAANRRIVFFADLYSEFTGDVLVEKGLFVDGDAVCGDFFPDNVYIPNSKTLSFGSATRQMIDLWGTSYGIGVQTDSMYFRSDNDFNWFRSGSHVDTTANPGPGGTWLMGLDQSGNLYTAGAVNPPSDRNLKENFAKVNPREVLEKVAALPITRWNYKDDRVAPHIGPVSQDFYAAFHVGKNDKHIATVDADGVALAAIQGLNQKIEEQNRSLREELNKRAAELEQLKRAVAELKEMLSLRLSVDDRQR